MAEENEEKKPPLEMPEELQRKLSDALQDVAFFLHEHTGASHIILDVKHISDALSRTGQTLLTGGGLGLDLRKLHEEHEKRRQELGAADPSKLAQEAIERALNAGKEKEKGGK